MEQTYMNYKNIDTEIDIKKSRFISHIQRTETEEEAREFIQKIKKEHREATHNCSAYIIGDNALIQRADDDGEPSGTAGVPMLEVLKRESLYNCTIVVTRYFGGIKLGAGGLIRAYSQSAAEAVKKSGKVFLIPMVPAEIVLDYTFTNKFEYFLGNENIEIKNQAYTDKVTYTLMIEDTMVEKVHETLKEITSDAYQMTTRDVEMAERVLVL
ncbi:YigZ family protein [Phocicoccus pinnipedialis]|uniref:IMPACT family member YigZ n=1 Tax=Phocicoccus pinnipedialis TaxID=110845 RepID=A0A6V7R121_9BACL|nr:YigZ family protein [Jeotgalicoccus pinnipedialis]MBP1938776.1 putative YigZ family protein [Jeotgalicoccus pinnipedialis]CAD2070764.1 IMPACT family member YigZ [Jeotgalicoccus pinnipedialis]